MASGTGASDVDDADRYFTDGDFEYAVRAAPAAFPNLLALDPVGGGGDLGQVLFGLIVHLPSGVLATRRDERWKVLVARRRRKFPRTFHVIAVEFFDTVEAAETRQAEIRQRWVAGSHADDPVITFRSVGKLRRSSRDAVSRHRLSP
jgi:hypothetical protein